LVRAGIGLVIIAALALSACGRKGPLEPPPTAAAVDQSGLAPAPPPEPEKKPAKHFFLDPLI
jgi:predicted small lipoprotein YifL